MIEEVWSLGAAIELDTSKTDFIRFIRWLVEGKLENRGREMSPWRPLGWHYSCAEPRWVSRLSPRGCRSSGWQHCPRPRGWDVCRVWRATPSSVSGWRTSRVCLSVLPSPVSTVAPARHPAECLVCGGTPSPLPWLNPNLRPDTFTFFCWRMCHGELFLLRLLGGELLPLIINSGPALPKEIH